MSERDLPREDEETRESAAESDETLAPGSMPGGPEYSDEASEDADSEPPAAPAH